MLQFDIRPRGPLPSLGCKWSECPSRQPQDAERATKNTKLEFQINVTEINLEKRMSQGKQKCLTVISSSIIKLAGSD